MRKEKQAIMIMSSEISHKENVKQRREKTSSLMPSLSLDARLRN